MVFSHLIVLFYILIFGRGCISTSSLTGGKHQNNDHSSLMSALQYVQSMDLLRQLINQETLVRLSMSKTVKEMSRDIELFKKTLNDTGKNCTAIKQQFDAELINIKSDTKLLKEFISKYDERISEQALLIDEMFKDIKTLNISTSVMLTELKYDRTNVSVILSDVKKNDFDINTKLLPVIEEFGTLKNTLKSFKSEILEKQRKQDALIAELQEFQMNLTKETDDSTTTSTSTSQTNTAFYVILTRTQGPGIIMFDRVVTNIGNRYDSSKGVFSVATESVCVFSWNVETLGVLTNTTLEVNGIIKGTVAADEASSYYDTSTSYAVLELKAADRVNIRVDSGRALSRGTAFSGWCYNGTFKDQRSAFYASMTSKTLSKPLRFDNVYTNQENVYTSSNGTFQAKRSGLYIFAVSLSAFSGTSTDSYVNIPKVDRITITKNPFSSHYDTTATMTVAYLDKGDQVYISENAAAATSMFAGWLASSKATCNILYPAFTASLSVDSSSTPLVFDKSHVNPHNRYSLSTGIFTAGTPGIYVFFWNIRAYNALVESTLRINKDEVGRTRSDGRSGSDFDDSSSIAVVQLFQGDQVYVRIVSGEADEGQSIFSGWLLFENCN